jgi:hypothetical protein
MTSKPFQIVLVIFLVVFTAAGAILAFSGIASLFVPQIDHDGIFAISGGISFRLLPAAILLLILIVAAVSFLVRRTKLR